MGGSVILNTNPSTQIAFGTPFITFLKLHLADTVELSGRTGQFHSAHVQEYILIRNRIKFINSIYGPIDSFVVLIKASNLLRINFYHKKIVIADTLYSPRSEIKFIPTDLAVNNGPEICSHYWQ